MAKALKNCGLPVNVMPVKGVKEAGMNKSQNKAEAVSSLRTSWKGKDQRAWVCVESIGLGLNRRPRHLVSGAREIQRNPLSPRVLLGSRHRALVPFGDLIPLSPQSANFRGSGVVRKSRPPHPPKSAEPAALRLAPGWGLSPDAGLARNGWGKDWRVPELRQRMAPGTTRRAGAHSPPARERGEGRDANEAGRVVAPAHLEDRAGGPRRAVPLHRIPSHPSAVPALTSGREGAGCERCWGAASRLPAGLSGGQRQRGRPPGGCSWLSSSRAPSRDAANAPAPQPSSPPPPRPRTEPPPAPPREQQGQRQPAPPSARPPGSPRRPPVGSAVPARCDAGRRARELPPRGDHPAPGPAAEDFLQGAHEDLPPLAGGATPASGTPTWRPVPEEWTGATTFPIPNPRLPCAGRPRYSRGSTPGMKSELCLIES
ncbi:TPA: hypothetical protein BOS_3346 [Bos taurus]|nr:TPA: hypothetical protein BOS_3346 [Bos taurus]